MMLLNGIVWIIMQHLRSRTTPTLVMFLTVINLIYKNLFYHQPFEPFINAINLFAKKNKNMILYNIVTMKIKI